MSDRYTNVFMNKMHVCNMHIPDKRQNKMGIPLLVFDFDQTITDLNTYHEVLQTSHVDPNHLDPGP